MRKRWDDGRVAKELMEVSRDGVMPSSNVLRAVGRNDLACAISKRGGFRSWSDRLGLRRRNSHSERSYRMERLVADRIEAMGYSASMTRARESYDLLVDGSLRVEVKMARMHTPPRSGVPMGYVFCFGDTGATRELDVAVLVCVDGEDKPLSTYVLPASRCRQQTITITKAAQWAQWLDRWSLITGENDE